MIRSAVRKVMWVERANKALSFGIAVVAVLLFGLLMVTSPAHATTTFNVNSTEDGEDANLNDSPNACDVDTSTAGD